MRPSILPATLFTLTLTLSACGDDDASSATTMPAVAVTSATPATTDVEPALATTTAPPDDTSSDTTSPDTAPPDTTSPDTTSPDVTETAKADTEAPAADATELCAVAEEINSADAPPTLEQMERYLAVAPPELQPAVETVIAAVTAADGTFMAIFEDPDASAAIEQISAAEAELCDLGDGPVQDASVTEIDPDATRIDVIATEYAYEAELPTEAGRYSFVMQNTGEEPHIMILIRLEDGVALDDVLSAEGDEGVAESFDSSPATPGGGGVLTADLGPGNWVLLCPIPGPAGHPHFVDGMIDEFTIT